MKSTLWLPGLQIKAGYVQWPQANLPAPLDSVFFFDPPAVPDGYRIVISILDQVLAELKKTSKTPSQ